MDNELERFENESIIKLQNDQYYKLNLTKSELINILTLRYNPNISDPANKSWKDFATLKNNITLDTAAKFVYKNLVDTISSIRERKVGISVSGGIDSSVVLAASNEAGKKLITFCVLIDGKRDPLLNKLLERYNTEHHDIKIERIFSELPTHIGIVKKPLWHIWSYYLLKYASKYCKTLIGGDGADELFGGYVFRYKSILYDKPRKPYDKVISYLNGHKMDWVPDQEKLFGESLKFNWNKIYSFFLPYFNNRLPLLNQIFLADYNGKLLHDWKPMFSSWARAFDLKYNMPFLSDSIVNYSLKLPNSLKYNSEKVEGKLVLRKLLRILGLNEIASQGKTGFTFDAVKIWKSEGKEIFDNIMEKPYVIESKLINKDWLGKTLKSSTRLSSVRYVNKLYAILALEIWYRLLIVKNFSTNTKL